MKVDADHLGHPGDRIAPHHKAKVRDPNLDVWAHFSYEIDSDFGPGLAFRGYDRKTHKYRKGYIHPNRYRLILDATIGLHNGASKHPAARPVAVKPRPAGIHGILDLLTTPAAAARGRQAKSAGDGNDGSGGRNGNLIPDNLVALQWITIGDNGFRSNTITDLKAALVPSPPQQAFVDLPATGTYTVTLRVVFANGHYSENALVFVVRDFLIISIGDSSASGEGNPDFAGSVAFPHGFRCEAVTLSKIAETDSVPMANEPVWLEKEFHRSVISGPALAALSLQHRAGDTLHHGAGGLVSLDKITFASFARSGAEIVNGLLHSQTQPSIKDLIGVGQIEEAHRTAGRRPINALLINIGGNDAGFAGVLQDLVEGDNVFTANDDNRPAAVEARLEALLGVNLPPGQAGQIEQDLDLLKADVDRRLQPMDVYITGYPVGLFDIADNDGSLGFEACGLFEGPDLDIDRSDYKLIKKQGTELNRLIERKARQFGWHYIDVAADFEGRGYCSGRTLWVGAEDSCRHQGDFNGTMHPNREGHALWALRYAAALRSHTVKPVHAPPGPARIPDQPGEVLGG